jgi:hypothetical protein
MNTDLMQYRAVVGLFDPNRKHRNSERKNTRRKKITTPRPHLPWTVKIWYMLTIYTLTLKPYDSTYIPRIHINRQSVTGKVITLLFWVNLLMLAGDVHQNPGPTNINNLSCYFINTQSVKSVDRFRSKLNEFRHMVEIVEPDIIAVNESWLLEHMPDSLFADEKRYAVYRKDRTVTTGGGVFIMVSKSIWSRDRKNWESQDPYNNEIKIAEIRPSPNRRIAIITAYRSQTNPCPQFLNNLDTAVTNCLANNVGEFIILGDFNYPDLKWENELDVHVSKNSKELLRFLENNNMIQFNKHPSRKGEDNILDLFITNITDSPPEVEKGRYDYTSDHLLFNCTFNIKVERIIPKGRTVLNYKRADFDSIKNEILENQEPKGGNVEETWSNIKQQIDESTCRHIPTIKIKNRYSPAWIDNEVIHRSHQKKCAFQKWKRTKKKNDEDRYKRIRNSLKNLLNFKYKEYLNNMTENMAENPKRFWTLLKDRTKSKTSPTLLVHDEQEVTDTTNMCTVFNNYFSSVFNTTTYEKPDVDVHRNEELSEIQFSKDDILSELKNLNTSKAPGPDGISTRVLKECRDELAEPFQVLFNQSLDTAQIPNNWKQANVVPIYKKGNKSEASNYRPVSLLPIISKVLERCVLNKILDAITPYISKLQHGFMKGKSTTTQITTVLSNIHNIFDNKEQTDVIYFDLSKAFDSVSHSLLIHKLQTFGINGKLLSWIQNYLTDRVQRVTMDGTESGWLPVTSGVPQGSILGPILFILYINDLPDVLSSDTLCAIYADDTKIYRKVSNDRDQALLQQDIERISSWGTKWGLTFNKQKTVHLSITQQIQHDSTYTLEGTPIAKKDSMCDLGLEVTTNLKWTEHINKIVKKANQRLGLIIRTLGYNAPLKAKKMAYISLVRSILETSSQVWSPTDKDNITKIEKVQRKATSFILNNPHITKPGYKNYHERLLETGLLPLTYRREIADLAFLCIHKHNTNTSINEFLTENRRNIGASTRSQTSALTYHIPRKKSSQAFNFYPCRVSRLWNTLPENLREVLMHQTNNTIIKQHITPLYKVELSNLFDPDNTCTWTHICSCPRCRVA